MKCRPAARRRRQEDATARRRSRTGPARRPARAPPGLRAASSTPTSPRSTTALTSASSGARDGRRGQGDGRRGRRARRRRRQPVDLHVHEPQGPDRRDLEDAVPVDRARAGRPRSGSAWRRQHVARPGDDHVAARRRVRQPRRQLAGRRAQLDLLELRGGHALAGFNGTPGGADTYGCASPAA